MKTALLWIDIQNEIVPAKQVHAAFLAALDAADAKIAGTGDWISGR